MTRYPNDVIGPYVPVPSEIGEFFGAVAGRALDAANKYTCRAAFTFNDITIVAEPGDTLKELTQDYESRRRQLARREGPTK